MPILDMQKTIFSELFVSLYRLKFFRKACLSFINRTEGGPFFSITLRTVLNNYHGVKVGDYSYGPCLTPGEWPSGVVVGRYVSVGPNVKVFLRNHPSERLSMHPFFYNHQLGFINQDTIDSSVLEIGHDTWIGYSSIILTGCKRIGIGAVIGAGSILTHDVPNFAIVGGNPARIIRYRFDKNEQEQILKSCWWNKPVSELKPFINSFSKDFSNDSNILNFLNNN